MRRIALLLLLTAAASGTAPGGGASQARSTPIPLGFGTPAEDIRITLPAGWNEFRFDSRPHPTIYRVLARGSEGELLAVSRKGASLLYTRITADVGAPELCWEWRVDRLPAGADLRRPAAEDAGARVYVGFRYAPELVSRGQRLRYAMARVRYGETPPYAGLDYVWTAAPAAGTTFVHHEWPRLGVVVLHDGREATGEWRRECRDLVADYRAIFGGDPPPVSHVGLMTDADDTRSAATGRYRRITLRSTAAAPPSSSSESTRSTARTPKRR